VPAVGEVDWAAAQAAVSEAAARLGATLRAVRRPDAPALGVWNLTDVAVHVSHTVDAITAMAEGGGGLLKDLSGLSLLSGALVQGETRRDLSEVADRIEAGAAKFVSLMKGAPGNEPRQWLVRGVYLPLSALTCHVLNELTVHGHDIARAEGLPWPISREHASLVVAGFLFPALANIGRQMVRQEAAAGFQGCYDIRLRGGGGRVYWIFDDGNLSVEPPSSRPVDCHVSADPAAFLLVAWGRANQWRVIARGQLFAWGRRPWMGPRLRSLMSNP
jgi:uncharacterized protein (TIGR03083 family)